MLAALVLTAAVCVVQPSPGSGAAPVPVTVTAGGDTGEFSLNPWTQVKRDIRREACQEMEQAAAMLEKGATTPDLGTTPYLRDLWSWGRDILLGSGIFALIVVASAAAGIWPGLNRYAAGAILPRLVVAVALLAAGPELLSMLSAASNGLVSVALRHSVTAFSGAPLVDMAASVPLVLTPLVILSALVIILLGIVRSFLLALFVVAGPFGNACIAWPGVDRWAKTWWRSMVVLALVIPLAQVLLAGVLTETIAQRGFNLVSVVYWQQSALILVAVVFQALVPLGLMVFALRPVHSQLGITTGAEMWRALRRATAR